ncbi:putative copper chaperone CopZ [Clostridiales bacterium oral taxon 876 str. F0540]|nr:putative copper chaperone CopZ [Clostridiales bacterium oral taxon 876 str. F0540]
MKKAVNIEGMSCDHCVKHVTEALMGLNNIENVDVNLSAGRAVIETDGEVKDSDIKAAVDEAGYTVLNIEKA